MIIKENKRIKEFKAFFSTKIKRKKKEFRVRTLNTYAKSLGTLVNISFENT